MVRRTKADAMATRGKLLDSAEAVFVRQGVARTTLEQVAREAGVTRGALYWHFDDKVALFDAMLGRARMPLESAMQMLEQFDVHDPLRGLGEYAILVFKLIEGDPTARRVYEIVTLKVEYVDEMTPVRVRRGEMASRWRALAEKRIHAAVEGGMAHGGVEPAAAALALWAIMDGLMRAWLLCPESFSLVQVGTTAIMTHIGAMQPRCDK